MRFQNLVDRVHVSALPALTRPRPVAASRKRKLTSDTTTLPCCRAHPDEEHPEDVTISQSEVRQLCYEFFVETLHYLRGVGRVNLCSPIDVIQASRERFIDVADVLRDIPQDHVFEDDSDEGEAIWDHEARFVRSADGKVYLHLFTFPLTMYLATDRLVGRQNLSRGDCFTECRTNKSIELWYAEVKPVAKVKGALDADQADILSAYSTEQGKAAIHMLRQTFA